MFHPSLTPSIAPAHPEVVSGGTLTLEVEVFSGPVIWELVRGLETPALARKQSGGPRISLRLRAKGECAETYYVRAWSAEDPGRVALTSIRVVPLQEARGDFEALLDNLFPKA